MGSFANTLFSALLGWVKETVSWLWQLIVGSGEGGLLGWLMANWLPLTVLICALGVLIDLVVYLFRWQPYRVWRSFFSCHQEEEELPEEEYPQEEALQWVYANGARVEEPPQPLLPEEMLQAEETPVSPYARPVQRVIPARRRRSTDGEMEYVLPSTGDGQQGYHQPYYPPQWRTQDDQQDGGTQA